MPFAPVRPCPDSLSLNPTNVSKIYLVASTIVPVLLVRGAQNNCTHTWYIFDNRLAERGLGGSRAGACTAHTRWPFLCARVPFSKGAQVSAFGYFLAVFSEPTRFARVYISCREPPCFLEVCGRAPFFDLRYASYGVVRWGRLMKSVCVCVVACP